MDGTSCYEVGRAWLALDYLAGVAATGQGCNDFFHVATNQNVREHIVGVVVGRALVGLGEVVAGPAGFLKEDFGKPRPQPFSPYYVGGRGERMVGAHLYKTY
jgi:hypothetical protein